MRSPIEFPCTVAPKDARQAFDRPGGIDDGDRQAAAPTVDKGSLGRLEGLFIHS